MAEQEMIEHNGRRAKVMKYGRGRARFVRYEDTGEETWIAPDYAAMRKEQKQQRRQSMQISPAFKSLPR